MTEGSPLILALDTETEKEMWKILEKVGDRIRQIKIGHRLFALGGLRLLRTLVKKWRVFLDLKLHDIPSVISLAVRTFAEEGVWALTLHTSGGRKMLLEAKKERDKIGSNLMLLGVTILTSLSKDEWEEIAPGSSFNEALVSRAKLCQEVGLDGLVCSAVDLNLLYGKISVNLKRFVPGIRLGNNGKDQARISTPDRALANGADFIVVGRSITASSDPVEAINKVERSIKEGIRWRQMGRLRRDS